MNELTQVFASEVAHALKYPKHAAWIVRERRVSATAYGAGLAYGSSVRGSLVEPMRARASSRQEEARRAMAH